MTEHHEQTETPEQMAAKKAQFEHQQRVRLYGEQLANEIAETQRKLASFNPQTATIVPRVLQGLPEGWKKNPHFALGASNLQNAKTDAKNPDVIQLTSVAGSKFYHMQDKNIGEFLGLTKKQKMTPQIAEDIMKTALARGWKSVKLHGSEADKAMMYREALKLGLAVDNYGMQRPNAPAHTQPEHSQTEPKPQEPKAPGTGLTPVVREGDFIPASKFSAPTVKASKPSSKFSNDDIIDVPFTEVKSLPGPATPRSLPSPKPPQLGHDK